MKVRILRWKQAAFVVLFTLLLSAAGVTNALAQTFTVGNLNYSLNDDGVSVTVTGHVDGQNATGELVIPESVEYGGNNYAVTVIGEESFSGCSSLTGDLVIPNSVTSILYSAFANCSGFTSLTIGTDLNYIVLNESYIYWANPFLNCSGITTLHYNAVNCINLCAGDYDGGRWSTFAELSSLTTLVIGDQVQSLPYCAFKNCSGLIGTLVIPNSVTTIGESAFENCTGFSGTLTIPEAITSIGGMAFAGDSFTTLNFNAINCGSLYCYAWYNGWNESSCLGGLDMLTTLNIGGNVQTIPDYAFKDFSGFTGNLVIPNTVTSIGSSAFENCSGYTGELILPDSLATIGGNAFKGCSGLSGTLTIPETITNIGSSAFDNLSITTVNFNAINCEMARSSYYNYDGTVFANCNALTTLNIGENVEIISPLAFYGIGSLSGTLTLPESITFVGRFAFANTSFTTINFNAINCTCMGCQNGWNAEPAFSGCSSLTTLNFGDQVQRIPYMAFEGCSNLTGTLNLPSSVYYIDERSFNGCDGFTGELIIPEFVIEIGNDAFANCSGFTGGLVIPNSVETIGNNAFANCSGLSGILTIGEGATGIAGNAFLNTDFSVMNYNAINCVIGQLEWDYWYDYQDFVSSPFLGLPLLTELNIGENVESISQMAFKDLTTLTGSLTLPNSLTTIGDQAFYNCYGFEGIVMGNSVETIGNEAFRNCGGFKGELTLPETLLSVGNNAFASCDEISTINYNAINCTEMGNAQSPVFYDCASVAHINIGANVQSIPNYAFKRCSTVVDMSVAAEVPPTIYSSTFGTVSRNIPVSVPLGSSPAYRTAQYWEEFFHITEDYSSSPYSYHWSVNVHQFGDNMTVTGIIQIDGVEQAVPYLEIGAFCDGECRGRQLLTYYPQVDRYLVFLMLYGEEGDMFTFKLYNHETNEESTAGCAATVTFEADALLGSFMEPFVFNFSDMQLSQFSQGYNWWSTYIEQEGINGLQMLQEGLGGNGIAIRSQASGYTDYYGEEYGWWGSLSSINNESSYRVITNAPCVASMAGVPAVPSEHPITLNQGWTWMGYVPSSAMDINTALDGMEATMGDVVKSQQGYSEYYAGYGWFGSLNTIEPGTGLMYYSSNVNPVTFTYPDGNRGGELKKNITAENNHWVPNVHAYPDNMTVLAVVELGEMELNADKYELAAFAANGECRGSVKLTYAEPINRHVAFLTVSGKDAAALSFRLYDTETNEEYYDAEESLDFVANAIVGAADDLYVVHFRGTTGMDELAKSVQIYPNPVNVGEHFNIGMANDVKSPVRVEIINALGVVVETVCTPSVQTITTPNIPGVYTLRIMVEGKGTIVRKLVVK